MALTLLCLIAGTQGNAFSVEVARTDAIVDHQKKAIKAEKADFGHVDADALNLYLARKDDTWLPSTTDGQEIKLAEYQ